MGKAIFSLPLGRQVITLPEPRSIQDTLKTKQKFCLVSYVTQLA